MYVILMDKKIVTLLHAAFCLSRPMCTSSYSHIQINGVIMVCNLLCFSSQFFFRFLKKRFIGRDVVMVIHVDEKLQNVETIFAM